VEASVIIDLPSTTTGAVGRKLVDLRDTGGAIALGRVLTLVIVTDEVGAEEAIEAANSASREHPCRVIVIVQGNRRGVDRLDAQIRVGGDAGASEVIVLRLYGKLATHGDSVVTPLLLPDAPLVAWWPSEAPKVPIEDPIGQMAQRRITDAAESRNPRKELDRRREAYSAGDTDLAWTRVTKWRGLLAAALDQPPYQPIERITVSGASDSPSTDLLAAWLADRLRCPVTRVKGPAGSGMYSVRLERRGGPIDLIRADGNVATLSQPGQPDRRISLPRRSLAECLAEELRRLDPDEIYAATLSRGLDRVDAGRSLTVAQAHADGATPTPDEVRRRTDELVEREGRVAEAIAGADPHGTADRSGNGTGGEGGAPAKRGAKKATRSTAKSHNGSGRQKAADDAASGSGGDTEGKRGTKSAAAAKTTSKTAAKSASKSGAKPAAKPAAKSAAKTAGKRATSTSGANGRQAAASSSSRTTTTRRTAPAAAASSEAPSPAEEPASASTRASGSDDVS
jgi:glucose-6-phosphate dehydrogenase assembly protein OpcA